jgi:hypothetical protein
MEQNHTPQQPEQGIETTGAYYQGWVTFTQWTTRSIIALVILLALMAATLV